MDARLAKLNKYKKIINGFDYAGLKREEALDLLRLGFRLYEQAQHVGELHNVIQSKDKLIKQQSKQLKKQDKVKRLSKEEIVEVMKDFHVLSMVTSQMNKTE